MKKFSGISDYKRAEEALEGFDAIYNAKDATDNIFNEYTTLSVFFQALFISDNGYVIDTGNFQSVNYAILKDILKKVKKHPKLWKLFMIC